MKKLKEFLQDNIVMPSRILEFVKTINNILSLVLFAIFNISAFLVGSLFVIKWLAEANLVLTIMLLVSVIYGFFIVLKSNR